MLELIKLEIGLEDDTKDKLVERYINRAKRYVMDFTRRDEAYILEKLENTIIDLTILAYNRRGTEGLQSQSVSGISESYLVDVPKYIIDTLCRHRRFGV